MKIAIVNTAYWPEMLGGAEHSTRELAEDLVQRGHQVDVFCLGSQSSELHHAGVAVHVIGSKAFRAFRGTPNRAFGFRVWWHLSEPFRIAEVRQLSRLVALARPQVVHLNNIAGFGPLLWVALRRFPTVQTVRDYYLVCTSSTGRHRGQDCRGRRTLCRLAKLAFRAPWIRPELIVGVSGHMSRDIAAVGIRSGRGGAPTVIYNLPRLGQVVDVPAERGVRLGYMGRLAADKGVEVILDAFTMMIQSGDPQDLTLLLAGGGEEGYMARLKSRYGDLVRSGRVKFAGTLSPEEYLGQIDLALVPTQWAEPFGRVSAEAMLAGRGVVYSAVGGLLEQPSLLGHGAVAVCDFARPEAWMTAIGRALAGDWDNGSVAAAMGIDRPVDRYLGAYDAILAGPPEPSDGADTA